MPSESKDCQTTSVQTFAAWTLLALAVVIVYAPVAIGTYGYGDDFSMFFGSSSVLDDYLSAGRPTLVLVHFAVHQHIREIGQLGLVRALAIGGALLLASVYFFLAGRWFASGITRVGFAVALAMLPSVQEYVAAAHCWVSATVAAAGSTAALMAHWVFLEARSWKLRWGALIAAFLLMEVALSSYQPAAMWYWSAVLFIVLDSRFLDSVEYRRATWKAIVAGLVFLVLGFVFMKAVMLALETTAQDRGQLATDPFAKIYWFARMQMTQALNLWQIYSGQKYLMLGTAAGTAFLIGAGYVVEFRRRGNRNTRLFVLQLGLAALAILASHCHWLVIVNMTQSYRVAGALCAAMWIALAWSISRLIAALASVSHRRRLEVVLFAAIAALSMLKCQHNLQRYFIEPYGTAYRYVLFSLRTQLTSDSTRVHMIRQQRHQGLINEELTQPFGWPFSMWRTDGVIELGLREAGVPHKIQTITTGEDGDPVPTSPETVVVDMRELVRLRAAGPPPAPRPEAE